MKKVIDEVKKINREYNYFNEIIENPKKEGKGKLDGIYFSVKDCICVKDVESRAGSAILNGYKPVFDATVVKRIKKQGGTIIGKTVQDEFGFGGFSVNVGKGFEKPLNPFDKDRVCGGSSGGAAGIAQKAGFRHVAVAESTGGSIVNPACFCGVIGLCPGYGRVSRYGLIDYANSLDKIGVMAKDMKDIALAMDVISGFDHNESTSLNVKTSTKDKVVNIGLIKESAGKSKISGTTESGFGKGVDKRVGDKVMEGVDKLKKLGYKVSDVSLPFTNKYGLIAYYLIALSEASTNLSRYCGMRYGAEEKLEGSFNDYFTKVRSRHLGEETKRRIMIGTFARMAGFRDAYYIRAMKVRTKIIEEYKKAFKKFDLLLSPTMPIIAPKFSEIEKLTPLENYMMDILTCGPNLAGLPHINIPCGFVNKMPVGLMLIGNHFDENKLIDVGRKLK